MRPSICTILVLSVALPLWSQVAPSASGGAQTENSDYMSVPSAISGVLFPLGSAPGERSNYLRGGLTFESAYSTNVLPGETSQPISDETYSIWPTLELDVKTPRSSRSLAYSSGYTFYQKTTVLNAINQNLAGSLQYRISPRTRVSLSDTFQQNTNPFNQPFFVSGNQIPGNGGSQSLAVIAPYANRRTNSLDGMVSYQFSLNGMIGTGGNFEILNYPDPNQSSGLYDSKAGSGMGFYARRVAQGQYLGVEYQYSRITTSQVISTTTLQTVSGFYSRSALRGLNLSLSGGSQHVDFVQTGTSNSPQWAPYGAAGIGWQAEHVRLNAEYGRTVTAGQGLLGVFTSDHANAAIAWRISRLWSLNTSGGYSLFKSALSSQLVNFHGGHSVLGTISMGYRFSEQLRAHVGYTRLHQSYVGVAAATSSPDSDRIFVSISYQFNRPLGR